MCEITEFFYERYAYKESFIEYFLILWGDQIGSVVIRDINDNNNVIYVSGGDQIQLIPKSFMIDLIKSDRIWSPHNVIPYQTVYLYNYH